MPAPPELRPLVCLQASRLVDVRPNTAPASPQPLRLENQDAASLQRPRQPAAVLPVGRAGLRRVRLESVSTPNGASDSFC
jgi:hypothetical protein